MTQILISAVVITRNEQQNLSGFLDNVGRIASEIIIIDDGSTDKTEDIAKAAGDHVRFIHHPMADDEGFAGQRNSGIAAATGDWVLNMDCDERLSPELENEIFTTLPTSNLNAYRYRRLNYFMHRPMKRGGWNTWNRPQIARRNAHRFEGKLHEACLIDGGDEMIGQMHGIMHHLNDFSLAQRFEKSAQYTAIEADRIASLGTVSARSLWWQPIREFLKKYLAQKGFWDGVPGFIAAAHSATAVFRAYALAWDRQNTIPRETLESFSKRD